MRDEFLKKTKEILKKRAAFICSNPSCRIMTIAPSVESDEKIQFIGKVAHITAASQGGPRYNKKIDANKRKSVSNGIFLCSNCADLIDKNKGDDYSADILEKWKKNHENWVTENLNKREMGKPSTLKNSSSNQSGGITANVINLSGFDFNQIDKKIEHDMLLFKKSDEILNEDDLEIIYQCLLGDGSIWIKEKDKLLKFKLFFKKSSNEYLNDKIQNNLVKLIDSLNNLLLFISEQFDMFPYNQNSEVSFRICMRPELNIDRRGIGLPEEFKEHTKIYSELQKLVESVEEDYIEYRRTIKKELYI
jgi:hypothetical protein